MNTEMNYPWHVSRSTCALSCRNRTSCFSLVAHPAFAEEVKIPEATGQPTEILAPAQETVVTNVEVKAPNLQILSQLILSYLLVQVRFLVKLLAVKSHHLN